MKKDFEGAIIGSGKNILPKNQGIFQQQIRSMKPSRFMDVELNSKEIASVMQDSDVYAKLRIGCAPRQYNRLLGYCVLLRTKKDIGLRPLYFNVEGDFVEFKPRLKDYLQEEVIEDPGIPTYVNSSLGRRAILESELNNNIFAAVEFGAQNQRSTRNSKPGASLVIPRKLMDTVPRLAHSELLLSRLRSEKGDMLGYYRRVENPHRMIDGTKSLVISGLIKATNSVK